jgi:hypothetical protein
MGHEIGALFSACFELVPVQVDEKNSYRIPGGACPRDLFI